MRTERLIRLATACFVLVAAAVIFVPSSKAQAEADTTGKTMEQAYKNIHAFPPDLPADQLLPAMRFFNFALGVECEYCHIAPNDANRLMQRDDKPEKATARKMIAMEIALNKDNFDGRPVVTCYTCHKGAAEPVRVTPFIASTAIGLGGDMPGAPAEAGEEPKLPAAMPTVDAILAKYVQALGGEQALGKFTSVTMTGTRASASRNPEGPAAAETTFEAYAAAPNLLAIYFHDSRGRTTGSGFDGKAAWALAVNGIVDPLGHDDLARAKRGADFYEPLDLKQRYARMNVQGVEKVNGHDVYVVLAAPQGDSPERLYFDAQTGLLVRKTYTTMVYTGEAPGVVDYGNYRDAGGVKYPYMIRISDEVAQPTYVVYFVDKVTLGTSVDQSKLAKPPSKPPAAQAGGPQ